MKIGIIGMGAVGSALYEVFNQYHKVNYYDPKYPETQFKNLLLNEIVFICVPTPLNDKLECETSIVESTVENLIKLNYAGVICIKSTVSPTTTIKLCDKYNNYNICFSPEFLKQKQAVKDFKNTKLCLIGAIHLHVFQIVKTCHQPFCKNFKMVHPTEAELSKYFLNVYNTYRIIFANTFYSVCEREDVNYTQVLNNIIEHGDIDDRYLNCNKNLKGPAGPCLMKDTIAFNSYMKKLEIPATIIDSIIEDTQLYEQTEP